VQGEGSVPQGERACLRPQAEFARASGRGLRRVRNFVQDAEGDVQKKQKIVDFEMIKDSLFFGPSSMQTALLYPLQREMIHL
jgi:hypothetical protein